MIKEMKPWLKYYPEEVRNMELPKLSLNEYLKMCVGEKEQETALEYYGNCISWKEIFDKVEQTAKALMAAGIGKGDQIPVFLQAVPEFVYLLLAAERLGASVLCRDGEISENVDAVRQAGAKLVFVHDFFSQEEEKEMKKAGAIRFVKVSPLESAVQMPAYVAKNLISQYGMKTTIQDGMDWTEFLMIGETIEEFVPDYQRKAPLLRAYTTGTTGTSKQVIHSAKSIIGVLCQMNFYSFDVDFRFRWLHTILPPSLVAVTVSMILSPLSSGKLLVLDPFVDVYDIDLSLVEHRANGWAMIPMFVNVILNSKRLEGADLSFFMAAGTGAEFLNNKQFKEMRRFLAEHNSPCRFTTGYGMSEAGSNCTLYAYDTDGMNFCYGIPLPLTTISIFEENTDKELGFHELGEICIHGPGVMCGYDNEEVTRKTLMEHDDGKIWLHSGDIGYMDENGQVYVLNRSFVKHHSGGNLFVSQMENKIIELAGIADAFFVTAPDSEHTGFYLPYLYVVPDGMVDKEVLSENINQLLVGHERPTKITYLKERPFFHFKTARKLLVKEILEKMA